MTVRIILYYIRSEKTRCLLPPRVHSAYSVCAAGFEWNDRGRMVLPILFCQQRAPYAKSAQRLRAVTAWFFDFCLFFSQSRRYNIVRHRASFRSAATERDITVSRNNARRWRSIEREVLIRVWCRPDVLRRVINRVFPRRQKGCAPGSHAVPGRDRWVWFIFVRFCIQHL